ncbi:MAG: mycothiol system anti-sigma-R factor [Longimicrobiales bacterium]
MSQPTQTSCSDVLTRLWEFIDGELTPERTTLIEQHLQRCQACFPQYDFQKAFVLFVRQQCSQPAPPGLRRKIFEMLLESDA